MIRWLKDTVKSFLAKRGYRLVAVKKDDGIAGFSLAEDLRFLVKSDAPLCFDVGANDGQTINLFTSALRNPRIHAFEPSSESFAKLKLKNFGPRISLHNCALGNQETRQEFINYEYSVLSSLLALDTDLENPFQKIAVKSKEMVDIQTIDRFMEQHSIAKIDVLKIDTQGYDLRVLMGAEGSFKKGLIDSVLVELNFVKMYENQSDAHHVSTFLADNHLHLVGHYEKFYQKHTIAWCTALYKKR